ncbi:MAG TPA: MFS transporter [Methanocorpusculum sp.]|nr:MFS transporter [Methanocorpusculum sp.]
MTETSSETTGSTKEKVTFKIILISIAACLLYGVLGFRSDMSQIIGIISNTSEVFSYVDIQLANTVCRFVTAFASPVIAFLVLKKSNFFILTFGFVTTILGLLCMAAATTFPMLVFGLGILFGVGTAALSFGIIFGIVSPLVGESVAVILSTIFSISATAFGVLFSPVIQLLSDNVGYQGMLVAASLLFVCVYPLIFVISGKKKEKAIAEQKKKMGFKEALSLMFKDKITYILIVLFFIVGFCSGISNHYYTGLLTIDIPSLGASITYSVMKIVCALGSFAAAFFIVKIKKTWRFTAGVFILFGITELIIAFLPDTALEFIPVTWFAVLVLSFMNPLSTLIIRRRYSPVLLASMFCFISLFEKAGSAINGIAGSIILETYGSFDLLLYMEGFAALALAAALICTMLIQKKHQTKLE